MSTTRLAGMGVLCALVAACGNQPSDLQTYVEQVKARPAAPIEPIPEIAPYTPYTYRADGRRAPFTPTTPERDTRSNSGVAPDIDRPREALEAFPLDALRMVGTITRGATTYALVGAPDNVIHRVRRGDHLGQNYGEIDAISDNGIVLTEIVPDGMGGYVKRPATIAPSR
ncbi:pilus assembly protein PilP [Salinisphaera sp. T31B1]|uniref:pilus assembly protein PilP n=1 Tax=Salinisphaera sp. T31B1 TaxID=727963 RepID=UPI00333F6DA8